MSGSAHAQSVITKANNTDALLLGSSWVGGVAPTGADIAWWNDTVAGAQTLQLGGDPVWAGLRITNPGGNITIGGANTLTLGISGIDMSRATQSLTIQSAVQLSAAQSWNVAAGTSLSVTGSIGSAGAGLTKLGAGTLTLSGANTYSGPTAVNGGSLRLDFSAAGAPLSGIVSSVSALQMGGGKLAMVGADGQANSQGFAATTFGAGLNTVEVNGGVGGSASLSLGNLTQSLNTTVRFTGTGTITAGTATVTAPSGLLGVPGGAAGINAGSAGYATFGLDDFAALNAGTVVAGTAVAGFYQTTYGGNFDMTANTGLANGGAQRAANVVRFNTPTATTLTSGTSNLVTFTGTLITPNMGANNAALTGGGVWQVIRQTSPNGAQQGTIWQNNPLAFYTVGIPIVDGREGTADPTHIVKAGAGTAVFSGTSTYTGRTSIYEGALMVTADASLGASATPISLAGGTLFSNASFNLSASRAMTLTGSGGIAASAGNTLGIGGIIGGAGELVIGGGLLAGTGDGTANPTPIQGSGKVELTGANFHTGGTRVLGGTLAINGINALGGANYGGLILNGGTLQYTATLTSGSDVTIGNGLSLGSAGGTVDTNGNVVSFAAGIQGLGALSKTGNGLLELTAPGSYAGGTVIDGGTLRVLAAAGSPVGSGGVTVNNSGTLSGTGTLGGAVTVMAGGTLDPGVGVGSMTVPGLTLASNANLKFEFNATPANDLVAVTVADAFTILGGKLSLFTAGTSNPWNIAGTYNLFSYAGAIQGAGPSAFSVVNPAAGYSYSFGSASGFVTVTVASSGLISDWVLTGGGSWGTAGNWSGGVPDQTGATANLAASITTGATITLDGNRTVGAVTFDNPNSYTIAQGSSGTLTLQTTVGSATLSVMGGSHTISAPVALASPTSAEVAAGGTLAVSGQLSGTQGLIKRGGGTLVLSGTNLHPATTLEAGTLEVGNNAALGGGSLTVTGDSILRAGTDGLELSNPVAISAGVIASVDTQAHTTKVSGVISGATGKLNKIGIGILELGPSNTYGGPTTVNFGTLKVTELQNGGVTSSIGTSPADASNLVLSNGALLYAGAGGNTDRLFTIGTAGGTVEASGTGALTFSSAGSLAMVGTDAPRIFTLTGTSVDANTLTPIIPNNGTGATTLVKDGTGRWILGGANTFTGSTLVVGGVLELGNPLALQGSVLNYGSFGGALSFGVLGAATLGGISGSQNLNLTNDFAGPVVLTVGVNNLASTYAGALGGTGALVKVGNGSLTLSGASTLTGSTTIAGGNLRLAANDALPATSQTFVNVGGGLLLSNGVTVSMPVTASTGAGEFVDVPDAGASATLAGPVTIGGGGNQYRLGISGAGATLTIRGAHTVGGAGNISFITRGNIVFADSGSLTITPANDTLQFGRFAGQPLAVLLKDDARISSGAIGFGGGQAGGAVSLTLQDNASVIAAQGKNIDLHGINANVPVTIQLNGGVLEAGSFTKFQVVAGRETFMNLNGGTIRAGATNPNFLPALTGLFMTVQAGGAKVNTAGFDVTITHPLIHDANLGAIADGGLSKVGAGTLTLAGSNAYTGPTTVEAGALIVTGSISGAVALVNTDGVLGGTGSVAGLSILGDLAPGLFGFGNPGRLVAEGAVSFSPGSSYIVDLSGVVPVTAHDQLQVGAAGGLTITGGELTPILGYAPSLGDTFVVVNNTAASPITGTFANLPDGGVLPAQFGIETFEIQADYQGGDGNDLVLSVVPEPGSLVLMFGGLGLLGVRRRRLSGRESAMNPPR